MGAPFDTLAAADALEAAGMDPRQAKACAAQLYAAAGAGEAVTRPELDAALADFKAEMLERFGETDRRIAETNARIGETNERIADLKTEMTERFGETDRRIAETNARLAETNERIAGTNERIAGTNERIADLKTEMTERMTVLLWRLFGGIVAVAGLAVAALKYLP